MAFLKYANAVVAQPVVSMNAWRDICAQGLSFDKREATAKLLLQKYDPASVLLSHATIMASVDVENGPGLLGRHLEQGQEVDRRFQDYYITPNTSKYANSNGDSWSRAILLMTYKGFVGGYNYLEHLQIPELSKGRIIDAAARDIGESVYIDILVATERKHKPLVASIESGALNTMSMGCSVEMTQCSKCGNVSIDETQLCHCIKYSKLSTFFDAFGKKRIVSELCGHSSAPNSVKFIEASWVANPAFKGAVIRNILSPGEANLLAPTVSKVFSFPAPIADPNAMAKAAHTVRKLGSPIMQTVLGQDFDFGKDQEFEGADDTQQAAPTQQQGDPLDKAVDDLAGILKEKALDKVKGEITKKELSPRADLTENTNNTLIKEASNSPYWRKIAKLVSSKVSPDRASNVLLGLLLFKNGGWNAVREANCFSGRQVLVISKFLDDFEGIKIAGEARVYKTVLAVGGSASYGDSEAFLAACRRIIGRELTASERDALITKGRLYDLGTL